MSLKIKKYLSYIVVIIFAWLNGTFIAEMTGFKYSGNDKPDLLWDIIIEPIFWGHLVNIFSVFGSIFILLSTHFKNIDIEEKVPYLAMWSSIILTIVLIAIGIVKQAVFVSPLE